MISQLLRAIPFLGLAQSAAAVILSVATTGGNTVSHYHYGIMFEDINHSGDGGIYAELIQNRAFQAKKLEPWTAVGDAKLTLERTSNPLSSALPNSLQVVSIGDGTVGMKNPGWWGIDVQGGNTYSGSFCVLGHYEGNLTAYLISDLTDEVLVWTSISLKSRLDAWTTHTFQLIPEKSAGNSNNSFVLEFDAAEGTTLNFNLISLFPPTYNNRTNGMRVELMETLSQMNPKFLRFPGGNNLEGFDAPNYWNWSATIGPLASRPGRPGTWTYHNTDGLGLVEYMHWCEDLEMEPVLAIWGGFYLDGTAIAEDEFQFYIDDALNELEFLTGNSSTKYGALRASLGYADPWKLNYVEVGNEDNLNGGMESYRKYRFDRLYDAIKAKYPEITVFSSTTDHKYQKSGYDYHEYTRPDHFIGQFRYFDNWNDTNPVMVGEYSSTQNNSAIRDSVDWKAPKSDFPLWIGTVAEAVFLLATERNGQKIFGVAYAPLLQNLNSYQWTPDLISFTADPSQTIPSVSYVATKLYAQNLITKILPTTIKEGKYEPAYWVAGENEKSYILKTAVYNATSEVSFEVDFEGAETGATGKLTVLTADGPFARNVLGNTDAVKESVTEVTADGDGVFKFELPDLSIAVLVVGR